jgi:phosphoserine phosphatase RsbU/P
MDMLSLGIWLLFLITAGSLVWSVWKRRIADKELSRTLQLFEVSLEVNSTILKSDLLVKIMETTERVMDAEASSVILVDAENGELFFELALGDKGQEIREIRLKIGEGIAGWVAQTGESVKIDDAASDARWSSKVANKVDYPTRNMLCVPIVSKGEIIGVLQVLNKRSGRHFTDRDLKLLQSIAAPTAISLENAMLYDALEKSLQALKTTVAAKERMQSELRIAHDIQMSFLPTQLSLQKNTSAVFKDSLIGSDDMDSDAASAEEKFPADVHALLRPAREVGGDFYDYFRIGEHGLFFTLGDVSDKGIPAALFMAVTMTLIKGKMSPGVTPGQLLTEVNRELYKEDSAMFATILCGVLDTRTGRLVYSDGGHCTPYIIRSSGVVEALKGKKGIPLAVMDDRVYADNEAILDSGDRLVLYTDGITEAEDETHGQYGSLRLQELLAREQGMTMKALLQRIVEDVDRFADGALQSDDIAVLSVQWGGN